MSTSSPIKNYEYFCQKESMSSIGMDSQCEKKIRHTSNYILNACKYLI